jgi:PIN domain nuclease of toxin-antitoxin system
MEYYVVDAHALAWFIADDPRLSEKAFELLEQAENAELQVLIPVIVLAEITYIAQRKRVKITIDELLQRIEQGDGFSIVPFDMIVFRKMLQLPSDWEIHDRIIAATAQYYQAKLITNDEVLTESNHVETVW